MITIIGISIIAILLVGGTAYVFKDFLKEFGLIGSIMLITGIIFNLITIRFMFVNIFNVFENTGSIYNLFTIELISSLFLTFLFFAISMLIRNRNVKKNI